MRLKKIKQPTDYTNTPKYRISTLTDYFNIYASMTSRLKYYQQKTSLTNP